MRDIFISLDIEADGPNIHQHNCIQIAMVACTFEDNPTYENRNEWIIDEFQVCIQNLPEHSPEENTMKHFWAKHQQIYDEIQKQTIPPNEAVQKISNWLQNVSSQFNIKYFMARPASYDWMWLTQLYQRYSFQNQYKLPFSVICLKSMELAMEMMNMKYHYYIKTTDFPHTHNALDDSISQAYRFLRIRKELQKRGIPKNKIAITDK